MKWNKFDEKLGSGQVLPLPYKVLLLYIESLSQGSPRALAVGYMKFAAGDKESPHFITPGHGGAVLSWSDCLPACPEYQTHRDEFVNYWQGAEESLR